MSIGAAVQAPQHPLGWFLKCSTPDLRDVVAAISDQTSVHNSLGLVELSWELVAKSLSPWESPDLDFEKHIELTTRIWQSLAQAWLNPKFNDEYNSIKHGLRSKSSAQYLALGAEKTHGVPASDFTLLHSAETGGEFYTAKRIGADKSQFQLELNTRGWNVESIITHTDLVVRSILNVKAYLLFRLGGAPQDSLLSTFGAMDEHTIEQSKLGHAEFGISRSTIIQQNLVDTPAQSDLERMYYQRFPLQAHEDQS